MRQRRSYIPASGGISRVSFEMDRKDTGELGYADGLCSSRLYDFLRIAQE